MSLERVEQLGYQIEFLRALKLIQRAVLLFKGMIGMLWPLLQTSLEVLQVLCSTLSWLQMRMIAFSLRVK